MPQINKIGFDPPGYTFTDFALTLTKALFVSALFFSGYEKV